MEKALILLGLLRQHKMHGYRLLEHVDNILQTYADLKKPGAYYLPEKSGNMPEQDEEIQIMLNHHTHFLQSGHRWVKELVLSPERSAHIN
jgi:hypothetical protein